MGRLFGTDGVRGLANRDLTAELALDLSVAAAHVLGLASARFEGHRPRAVVGRDPRASGEFLAARRRRGSGQRRRRRRSTSACCPRPRVAYLTGRAGRRPRRRALRVAQPDAGQRHQVLRPRRAQARRRRRGRHRGAPAASRGSGPTGAAVGRIRIDTGRAGERVRRHLVGTIATPARRACASRSTARTARRARSGPQALRAAGADVVVINASPGRPQHQREVRLDPPRAAAGRRRRVGRGPRRRVRRRRRPLPRRRPHRRPRRRRPDHGHPRDRACATRRLLAADTLVATVMSNLGLKLAMTEAGIATVRDRGRRPVRARGDARRAGTRLGGEQSGHVIMAAHATTGDGVLTALQLAARVAATGQTLAELAGVVQRLPQVLVNVPGRRQGARRHRRGRCSPPSPPPRRGSATPAGCCCARPAPSPSCGSWSRRAAGRRRPGGPRARRRRPHRLAL